MEATGMATGEIAAAVAVIAAAGLALAPQTKATIDALKSTRLVPAGYGGVAALLLGMLVGLVVGVLAAVRAGDWVWLLVGALGGLFAGTNAIQLDQAASKNTAKPATAPEPAADVPATGMSGMSDQAGLDI